MNDTNRQQNEFVTPQTGALCNTCHINAGCDTNFCHRQDKFKSPTNEETLLSQYFHDAKRLKLVQPQSSQGNHCSMKLNTTPPIHQVPLEILTEVFCWVLEPNNHYVYTLQQLALVCRRWCSHVKGTTELWTAVRTDQTMDEVLLVISKAKERPIRAIIVTPELPRVSQLSLAGENMALYALEQSSSGWESVEFSGPFYQADVFQILPPAPNLRDISFRITLSNAEMRPRLPNHLYDCNLRHVQLLWVSFDWKALLGAGLVTLDIENPATIPNPEELCQMLSKCPKLANFRLWGSRRRADDGNDIPQSWTDGEITMPSLTSLELKYLPPGYLSLLRRITAPKRPTIALQDEHVIWGSDLVEDMPPLTCNAVTGILRLAGQTIIRVNPGRGLFITAIPLQIRRPPIQLDIITPQPMEVLNTVGDLLVSSRINTPISLSFDDEVLLTESTMEKFSTLREISVVGEKMCEALFRYLAPPGEDDDRSGRFLWPDMERIRMTYRWGEVVPDVHYTLLSDLVRDRWGRGTIDNSGDVPVFPAAFDIFPPGEVSVDLARVVEEAQKIVPNIRVIEDEE